MGLRIQLEAPRIAKPSSGGRFHLDVEAVSPVGDCLVPALEPVLVPRRVVLALGYLLQLVDHLSALVQYRPAYLFFASSKNGE